MKKKSMNKNKKTKKIFQKIKNFLKEKLTRKKKFQTDKNPDILLETDESFTENTTEREELFAESPTEREELFAESPIEREELSAESPTQRDDPSPESPTQRDDPSPENPLRFYDEVILKKDFIESGILVPKGSYCMIDSTGYVLDEGEAEKRYLLNPIGIEDEAGVELYFLAKAEDFFRKKYEPTIPR